MTHTGNDTAGQTCEVDGIDLHYRTDGDRAQPCLVLSNSLGTDLSMWQEQAAALAGDFFVVRYDTRGHGQSVTGAEPFGIERLGLDVVALLDHLDVERAAFCGISMGGLTGQWLGIHQAQCLTQLVLANTAARIGSADAWLARAEQVRRDGMAAVADGAPARWFTPQFIAREADTVARMVATLRSQDAGGYAACCDVLAQTDLHTAVGTIAVPTLIIAGEHDPVTTIDDGRWLQQQIAGARLASLPASHISNVEAADLFTAQLRTFLL
ncbi:3-oxoadipate enol-lactonase [Janthinobacterium sp. PAMC25594]|uniref:3-oxoadipate enol-lactonase n=1 Tax=Janthinobacterium sp. PAMC25594 TaxID=2861284 RepID=UPI001C62B679|nr:3-oxoadipate enol-lactonase [Janthinobacterium sp. PAMC25594]QYG09533.1 3-oxoadipate enol-lactonase [Janthinobacterium sp. PAMC25594]